MNGLVRLSVPVSVDELVESVSLREAEDLIKALDREARDYQFTEDMAIYFVSELIRECRAAGDEFKIEDVIRAAEKELLK